MKLLKKQSSILLVIMMMIFLMVPYTVASASQSATVIASTLNVRSGPSTSYSKLGSITKGQKVTVSAESNGWATISYKGKTAYVSSMYLKKYLSSASSVASGTTATVTASRLNIRTGKSTSYSKVTVLPRGTKVTILAKSGSYYYISIGGKKGYAPAQYLSVNSSSSSKSTTTSGTSATVIASSLNVRSGPSTSYSRLGSLRRGQAVKISSESGGWAKITYNGRVGYVSAMYLKKSTASSTPSSSNPSSPSTSLGTATVTASRLNIRTGKSTSYSKVTVLPRGTKVTVLAKSGSYYYISTGSKKGYAPAQYFSSITSIPSSSAPSKTNAPSPSAPSKTSAPTKTSAPSSPSPTKSPSTNTAKVIASKLNVRSGPSTSYSKVGTLTKGQSVTISSESNGWSKITYNGRAAYVASMYLQKTSSSSSGSSSGSATSLGTATVTASRLNIRTGKSTSYSKVTVLPRGTKVTVLAKSGSYYYISTGSKKGYAPAKYFSAITPTAKPTPTPTPTAKPTPTVSLPTNAGTSTKLSGKTVIVDAGHGGKYPGACYSSVAEKTINLSVALKLKEYLEDNGATVIMTRTTDIDIDIYSRTAKTNWALLNLEKTKYADAEVASVEKEITNAKATKETLTSEISALETSRVSKTDAINDIDTEIATNHGDNTVEVYSALKTEKEADKASKEAIVAQIDAEQSAGEVPEDTAAPEPTETPKVVLLDGYADLDAYKAALLKEITALETEISGLEAKITDLNDLQAQKEQLTTDAAYINTEITNKQAELDDINDKIDNVLVAKLTAATTYKSWVDGLISDLNKTFSTQTGTDHRKGIFSSYTLADDSDLKAIFDLSPKHDDIIFVSLHADAATTSSAVSGISVYTTVTGDSSSVGYDTYNYNKTDRMNLANSILSAASKASTIPYRGVITKSLAVTRENNIPAVLVEMGFMTNSTDLAKLTNTSYQKAMASGITKGIMNYFDSLAD